MSEMNRKLGEVSDMLATIRYLNEAVNMAAGDSGLISDASTALQALTGVIDDKIRIASERLYGAMEELR